MTSIHLNDYFSESVRKNWDRMALKDFDGASYQYKDVARKIAKLHLLFNHIGIAPGDKIALCGRNSAAWAVTFFAALSYGAVIVPILHEFKADTIHHLVNHSDARLFFVDRSIWDDLDPESMQALSGVLAVNDFTLLFSRDDKLDYARSHLNEMFGHKYPERFTSDNVRYYADNPDEIALISYTSGSTGFSKGVMLTFGNLRSNLQYCLDNLGMLEPGDGIVSMLPMAHMYGLMVDVVYGFSVGANLNFLTRVPSPRVITAAFEKVRPKLIVAVPLIIEKIIRTRVYPLLEKPLMKLLLRVPYVDDRLLAKIKKKLQASFGDNLHEIILGGAAVNPEVEKFMKKIGFPYTIGYGMTECAPLISYSSWREARIGSCGQTVDRMSIRVDSPNPSRIPGVLWVKGENVMAGYYKNPDATAAVMRDGWMSTGDICTVDSDGFIYIRGRNKNMILGPSGQNIYPEEIEHTLNNMALVGESLIVEEKGRLVALIYPDYDAAQAMGLDEAAIDSTMRENISLLNREIPSYSQVSTFRIMDEEFEKTPKRSIKRYLYQHS
jgi:long-chain acyl-CoA synthetase